MSVSKAPALVTRPKALPVSPARSNHVVQFYQEDPALIDELARLIGISLASGDGAIVIATKPHRDALVRELAVRGVNIPQAIAEGRYLSLDAAETLSRIMPGHMPNLELCDEILGEAIAKVNAAGKTNKPCTVIFGEMVALLWARGKHHAAIRLEELWNTLADRHSFSLRCAYPMKGFNQDVEGELFVKICAEHSSVVPLGANGSVLSDDEHRRTVAKLQQRVEVLESERALRASEQRFRLLVEAVQDYAIFTLDQDGRVNSWNVGAERLKGYKASEILGEHFSRFYPQDDIRASKPQREIEIALRDGRVEDEGWRVRKDGSMFWANVVITALKDQDGRAIGFSKVTRDFTERMQAQRQLEDSERKLRASEESLRDLSLHLLRTQDEERRRIGRDLHDSLGQYLSVLKMKLDGLKNAAAREKTSNVDDLAQCVQLTEEAVKEVRTISYLLYPPMLEEMGLKSAIPWYLEGFTKRSGIKTTFEITPDFGRVAADVELAFFRVLQESLTNVHRHSGSPTATVRLLNTGETVVLEISDQGKGVPLGNFEEGSADWLGALGVGLRGMSERVRQIGGKLELSSTKRGTTVAAVVPIHKAHPTVASQQ